MGKPNYDVVKNYIETIYFPVPNCAFIVDLRDQNTLTALEQLFDFSHRNKIKLKIFFPPLHATMMEVIYRSGIWDRWEFVKKTVVAINIKAADRYNESPFPIYDFSGYNEYTTEVIQSVDNMKWYTDIAHYKLSLGNKVVDRINGKGEDFLAKELNPKNINKVLSEIRLSRLTWIANLRKEEYSYIDNIYKEHMESNCKTVRSDAL
jgi:hypothetical protein